MDEQRDSGKTRPTDAGQGGPTGSANPAGAEVDDSVNPTAAAPDLGTAGDSDIAQQIGAAYPSGEETTSKPGEGDYGAARVAAAAQSGEETWSPSGGASDQQGASRAAAGREMLVQLQQMIDTVATQAAPVMREVAAKAAELAAIAGEKAGPLAHRAAGVTEHVGQRVAARSKELAAEWRQPRTGTASEPARQSDDAPRDSDE